MHDWCFFDGRYERMLLSVRLYGEADNNDETPGALLDDYECVFLMWAAGGDPREHLEPDRLGVGPMLLRHHAHHFE